MQQLAGNRIPSHSNHRIYVRLHESIFWNTLMGAVLRREVCKFSSPLVSTFVSDAVSSDDVTI